MLEGAAQDPLQEARSMIILELSTVAQIDLLNGLARLIEIYEEGITRVPIAETTILTFRSLIDRIEKDGNWKPALNQWSLS